MMCWWGNFLLRVRKIMSVWVFWDSDAKMEFHTQEVNWKKYLWKKKEKMEQEEDRRDSRLRCKSDISKNRETRKDGWKRRTSDSNADLRILSHSKRAPEQTLPFGRVPYWIGLVNLQCSATGPGRAQHLH